MDIHLNIIYKGKTPETPQTQETDCMNWNGQRKVIVIKTNEW